MIHAQDAAILHIENLDFGDCLSGSVRSADLDRSFSWIRLVPSRISGFRNGSGSDWVHCPEQRKVGTLLEVVVVV